MSQMRATIDEARGSCLCGAVRFVARDVPPTYTLCHCSMCRPWTGIAFAEVSVPTEQVAWDGAENIQTYRSSDHAERAFCRVCGSTLYFRQTKRDKWFGSTDLALGLFDDPYQFVLTHEIFADEAAVSVAEQGQTLLTRADVLALNPSLAEVGA